MYDRYFNPPQASLKYTRFAWAGGTFSPVVLLCQFSILARNRFWFYILLMYLGYRTIQLWCCVSFFGSGRKKFLVLRTYLVYNTVVQFGCVSFFVVAGKLIANTSNPTLIF
jgi:hypothetical protein